MKHFSMGYSKRIHVKSNSNFVYSEQISNSKLVFATNEH